MGIIRFPHSYCVTFIIIIIIIVTIIIIITSVYLDLPLPRGCGGPCVYVYVDLVAGVGGGHPHVLARVVAADGGRDCTAWVCDGQGVRQAVSSNWA